MHEQLDFNTSREGEIFLEIKTVQMIKFLVASGKRDVFDSAMRIICLDGH